MSLSPSPVLFLKLTNSLSPHIFVLHCSFTRRKVLNLKWHFFLSSLFWAGWETMMEEAVTHWLQNLEDEVGLWEKVETHKVWSFHLMRSNNAPLSLQPSNWIFNKKQMRIPIFNLFHSYSIQVMKLEGLTFIRFNWR